jgi:hypothetical protein
MTRKAITALAAVLFLFLVVPVTHSATETTVELNVNHETVEGGIQLEYPLRTNLVSVGYDAIYNEDEYRIAGAEVLLGNALTRDLECYLGFRGEYGELTALPQDPNLSHTGFTAKVNYTLPLVTLPFPVVWGNQLTVSPKPLSFGDTENYWSVRTNLDFNVLQSSGITTGFRYREADMEKRDRERSYDEGSVFIGYKLTF